MDSLDSLEVFVAGHRAHIINQVQNLCYQASQTAGWWKKDQAILEALPPDLHPYAKAAIVLAKIALQHSELSEAVEGYRKNLADDHLPHRQMIEVELADVVIRAMDLAGWLGLNLGEAMMEKLAYNKQRADHKEEAREQPGGKII